MAASTSAWRRRSPLGVAAVMRAECPTSVPAAREVEADHTADDERERQELEDGHAVTQPDHADHGGERGVDAGPHGVRGADRELLERPRQAAEADDEGHRE